MESQSSFQNQTLRTVRTWHQAETFDRMTKHRLSLRDGDIELPVLLAVGAERGKTLVVTAAVHGDEYEGVRAVFEVFDELDPTLMSGNFLAVPVVNGPAFWAGARRSPLDGADLARVFPGKADGSTSERTAFLLAEKVISQASLYLDLHSGGVRYQMPSMVGCDQNDPRSCDAAVAFGSPVIWSHDEVPDGRTISFARSRGIPWLYTEARGAGRIDTGDLQMMKRGMTNLLRHLHILPGSAELSVTPIRLKGNGNTDEGILASAAGFLISYVKVMQAVNLNDRLGVLVDVWGRIIEEYRSPWEGIVALVHEFSVVSEGATLFLIASAE